jgi:hypothetical protein
LTQQFFLEQTGTAFPQLSATLTALSAQQFRTTGLNFRPKDSIGVRYSRRASFALKMVYY